MSQGEALFMAIIGAGVEAMTIFLIWCVCKATGLPFTHGLIIAALISAARHTWKAARRGDIK